MGIAGLSDGERVGAGGNAVAYRAREVDHDRWVAVKVLRLADEAALRRFDRERRAMGRLSEHEGIVTIYHSGFTAAGEPYLVMPLLSVSLQDQLDPSGMELTFPRFHGRVGCGLGSAGEGPRCRVC